VAGKDDNKKGVLGQIRTTSWPPVNGRWYFVLMQARVGNLPVSWLPASWLPISWLTGSGPQAGRLAAAKKMLAGAGVWQYYLKNWPPKKDKI